MNSLFQDFEADFLWINPENFHPCIKILALIAPLAGLAVSLHICADFPDINCMPANGNFCQLLIIFAKSLYPDQARQNVWLDLDTNCLTPRYYSRKNFGKILI